MSASWGSAFPAGTPSGCRNAKLTGSMQSLLQVAKPKCYSRLSIVSAAHQCVASQLGGIHEGLEPRRVELQLQEGRSGVVGSLLMPVFESLSGMQRFSG